MIMEIEKQKEFLLLKVEERGEGGGGKVEEESVSREQLVEGIVELHGQISKLESLRPCERVNALFSQLVALCLRPCDIDVNEHLAPQLQEVRHSLIQLCGQAEGLLERYYAKMLIRLPQPHTQLHLFPYYSNYRKLALQEFKLLRQAAGETAALKRVAFIGSGPMPLTSIVLAAHHMQWAAFDNYDLDGEANSLASRLIGGHADLAARMAFHTCSILDVEESLAGYDVVFLAALVGTDSRAKAHVLQHLARHMRAGAALVLRSAHGPRAFLYHVVSPDMLRDAGFDVLSIFHPSDDVVNSVIVSRKHFLSSC